MAEGTTSWFASAVLRERIGRGTLVLLVLASCRPPTALGFIGVPVAMGQGTRGAAHGRRWFGYPPPLPARIGSRACYPRAVLVSDDNTQQDERRSAPFATVRLADHLFLVAECARPHAGGVRCDVSGVTQIVFGRGDQRLVTREPCRDGGECLTIRVPDRWMSTTHARLVRTTAGFKLEDAASRNGSLLDGEFVSSAVVEDGALIELGRTFFIFRERLRTPRDLPLDVATGVSEPGELPLSPAGTLLPSLGAEFEVLARIAESDVPILLLGETGTGKEVLSRWIHAASNRRGPMVAVNCGAIPRDLVASSLFGHRRGAFSGATENALGFFRTADKGTLLLDEIGDLPRESQVALLRVLQEHQVVPVGSAEPVSVDVRVIAATHAPLVDLVATGSFRADLLNRLAGHTHRLTALRDRREDIGLLIARIVSEGFPNGAGLQMTGAAGRAFLRCDWPGNVRQMRQVLERAAILSRASAVDLEHLPPEIAACAGDELASFSEPMPRPALLSDEDREVLKPLEAALIAHRGNVTKVAEAMGKKRMQIQRWMKRFGLDASRFRDP